MVESATRVILVADHTKFGRVTFGRVCGLEQLDAIVTDDGLPERLADAIAERGLKLYLACASGRVDARAPRASRR